MSKELRTIVERFDALPAGARAALATVVDVRGSSYRLPGARMLVDDAGGTFGTVSGGCLEADLLERARRVVRTGDPELIVYDTSATDDAVFGLNLGCRGVVRILLEPADEALLGFLRDRLGSRHAGTMATLVDAAGGDLSPGTRLMVDERGVVSSGFDPETTSAIAEGCLAVLDEERSRIVRHAWGELFVEYLAPPMPLVIFGAGPDAVPVVRFAKELGWRVTLVDHRPAMAARPQFAAADEVVVARPEAVEGRVSIDGRTAAVVMTHNYSHDLGLLELLLRSEARYVGVLGPRARTDRLLGELATSGTVPGPREMEKLYAPVGIDIGAESPEEIALSILAEVRAVTSGRRGGMLRDRDGAIHERREEGTAELGGVKSYVQLCGAA
jgi:xanthine/CO dehydrogenase XdhC/CoxF family maturation factor